ncbi:MULTISPECIES: TrmH family RNA methyltransferase [Helcococcus]|uniref:RNA methyltransferase n=1 Tax=Helcococcus bovis TaxID=3153252 RepID=A0ABW9F4J0_9FIRM
MYEKITSSNSNFIKEIKKLRQKKYRQKLNKFIIESKKLILEAISSGYEVENIFVVEGKSSLFDDEIYVSEKLFDAITSMVNPDGYLAIVKIKKNKLLTDKVLILDNIQDPGNMGTLIRSAEAFGFNTIVSINSVDFYNEKVLRATMGSGFRLNLIDTNYKFLENMKDYTIYIADMDGYDYRKSIPSKKIAIVIGNEGNGISDNILSFNHELIKIPMLGKIESLNAGVSGSILMSNFIEV